jgi:hypothetical protein
MRGIRACPAGICPWPFGFQRYLGYLRVQHRLLGARVVEHGGVDDRRIAGGEGGHFRVCLVQGGAHGFLVAFEAFQPKPPGILRFVRAKISPMRSLKP